MLVQLVDILWPHFWLELDNCSNWLNCGPAQCKQIQRFNSRSLCLLPSA